LDKISKNALIWIAVFGDSFASSACSSFKLLFTNMARVAAINMVADYLLFIGKVLVMCFTGAVGAYWVSSDPNISSPILPTIIMLFIGYIVGQMFMIIFENVVDTIFLCFLMDESRNKGKAGGMLAGRGLQDLVNDHAHASAALAAYQKAGSPEEAKALKSNYKAAYGGKVDPSQLPAEADLDGDGVISEAEAKAHRKGETSD
jgi:solute carrier family 44 protein 1 (choline transporter-like protein)